MLLTAPELSRTVMLWSCKALRGQSAAAGVRLKAWFRPRAQADEKGMLK